MSWLQWEKQTFLDNSPEAGKALALSLTGLAFIATPSVPLLTYQTTSFVFNLLLGTVVAGHMLIAMYVPVVLEEWRQHRYKITPLTAPLVVYDEDYLEYIVRDPDIAD